MKKRVFTIAMLSFLFVGTPSFSAVEKKDSVKTEMVAEATTATTDSAKAETVAEAAPVAPVEETKTEAPKKASFHQIVKEKIIEGGVTFMSIVLLCLVLGLTIAIERVITLNLASTDVKKLMNRIKEALQIGGIASAKDVCASSPSPVASIIAQGLIRVPEGLDNVSDSISSHGSAEMIRLEKGMSWIALFISLAPMFGFMGTVIGMIDAFDTIQQAEDIKIDQVAGGIKVALLTTVAGLIVAVILQVFYNYLTAKLDTLAEQMEDANNDFIDILVVTDILNKKPSEVSKKATARVEA